MFSATSTSALRAVTLVGLLTTCSTALVACAAESGPEAPKVGECVKSGAAALRVCADGPTLKGIDVSYYESTVNWTQVKSGGIAFAFARVSDGTGTVDNKFAANWPAMKAAGVIRGAYQFFRPSQDVTAQVNLFIAKVDAAGGLKPGDLPPVLDLETTSGLSPATVASKAQSWLTAIEAHYGVKPILYTGNNMTNVTGTAFGGYTLWVPNYTTSCPSVPSGWAGWTFWQNSDSGSVSGVSGGVDTDFFNGTETDLQALTIQATTPNSFTGDPPASDPQPSGGDQGAKMGSSNGSEPAPSSDPCR